MSLWRERDFLKLWAGQAVSEIGSRISREGIPLSAVLILHASPFQMGVLAATGGLVAMLASPVAGTLADRFRRRPLLIAADLGRAAALAVIPWAYAAGTLSMAHLLGVVAATGALAVLFDVAYPSMVPSLVRRDRLLEANARLALTTSVAEVTGPAMTGVLIRVFTAPVAILLDAVSFVASAVSIAWIRAVEPQPEGAQEPGAWSGVGSGFLFVFRHPLLRPLAMRLATASLAWGFFITLYVYYAIEILRLSPVELGIVITLGGVGNLAGAMIAERVTRRAALGRVLIAATLWQGAMAMLLPVASQPGWTALLLLGGSQLFGDVAYPIFVIHELTLRQRSTPPELLGRVNACFQLVFKTVMPMGALCGGALAAAIGVRATLLLSALGIVVSAGWLIFSPVRRLMEHPEADAGT